MSNVPSILNPVLQRWLRDQPSLVPNVNCNQCSKALARPRHAERWQTYKCCTFQPFVSAILAGAMIAEGLDPLEIQHDRAALRPIGVLAQPDFRRRRDLRLEDEHGLAELCSYYDLSSRRCRIWRWRPGECSSYFCSSEQDPRRVQISEQIFEFEAAMAQMALVHLGFSAEQVAIQVEELNDPESPLKSLNREEARGLYLAAWEWAQTVSVEEARQWVGFDKLESGL